VVGAGAGGCVAAARLFDAGYEVHLFEAGEASVTNTSPHLAESTSRPDLIDGSVFASTYTGGSRYPYLRGRALGGTTAINALVQMWGTKDDWDAWSVVHGCTGWNWRSVSAEIALLGFPSHFASASETGPVTRAVLAAARAMGAGDTRHAGETYDGAGAVALSLREGRRADAFSIFVTPRVREDARRMVVHAGEPVGEIAVEADRAHGVVVAGDEFVADGVILAAGTMWSPILLRRSGVSRAGIGRNLKDHPAISLWLRLREGVDTAHVPLDVTGMVVASSVDDSDINLLPVDPNQLVIAVTKVSSVGHVVEVDGTAEVVLGTIETHDDATRMLAALRLAEDLCATREFGQVVESVSIDAAGTPLTTLLAHDDETVISYVRRQPGAYSHAVGTCRMGVERDSDAVVDNSGAVFGVDGLWVADASVFPDIPRAATHLPVMAVAGRIASGIAERLC
jgi:choline dehydrogenase/5-(hydroxymethyl)furfural/furfural oxidase